MLRMLIVVAVGAASGLSPARAQQAKLHPDMAATPIGNVGQWFGAADYPKEAMRAGRQGRVVAKVGVDSSGQVVSCTIQVSSGTTSLDDATCNIATSHIRFNPATDHEGNSTAGQYRLSIRWQIPIDAVLPAVDLAHGTPDNVTEFELTFDAEGVLLACRALAVAAPMRGVNPCQGMTIGSKSNRRYSLNGKPVGAIVVQRFSEHITPAS